MYWPQQHTNKNIKRIQNWTLRTPLSDMINVCFNKEIFPDFLKVANTIPICKKGEKLDPNLKTHLSIM